MSNTAPASISAQRVLRLAREELRTYGATERYARLIALWNRQLTWEYER